MTVRQGCEYGNLNRANGLSCTDEDPCRLCRHVEESAEATDAERFDI